MHIFDFYGKIEDKETKKNRKETKHKMDKMDKIYTGETRALMDFIKASPTAYHAVDSIGAKLEACGFLPLSEADKFEFTPGGKYYVTRGRSSIIAFKIPNGRPSSFMIAASHSDSPTFKLKDSYEMQSLGKYTRLNVERYGGMIMSSWFDRPLSIAGRVIIDNGGRLESKTVDLDRDVAIIPNVCIHFNRQANEGYKYNAQTDMSPLIGSELSSGLLKKEIAEAVGANEDAIVSSDLFLYNRTAPAFIGLCGEYFSAPRIDNLGCAFATFEGFTRADGRDDVISVCAMFDNEETGSQSKQGAASTFLYDILTRITLSLGIGGEDYLRMLASSFMVSADNGHAKHPNHPELSDADNSPFMNGGVVIKYNANQRYTTDAVSAAIFEKICARAGVPTQKFANRSDVLGGSTLGNISNSQVSLNTVDIGLSQLAMHSAYETAGTADVYYMVRAMEEFFNSQVVCSGDGCYEI